MGDREELLELRRLAELEAKASGGTTAPAPASLADKMVGGWGGRTLMGMASPVLAAAQLLGGETGRKAVGELDAMKQRGMAAEGKDGFDWYGLLGSMVPSTAIAKGVSAALPAAQSVLGRAGVGATQGAAVAAGQPVSASQPEDFWPEKAAQVGTGATVGGLVPLGIDAVKGVSNVVRRAVEPLREKGRAAILQRYQESLLGDNATTKQRVVDALTQAKAVVPGSRPTAGEALAALDPVTGKPMLPEATGLMAHQQSISKMRSVSPEFAKRAAEQELARASALSSIARNEGALEGERSVRSTITSPMREAALTQANVAGQEVPQLERTITQATRATDKAQKQLAAMQPKTPPVDPNALRSAVETHAPAPLPTPLRTQSELMRMKLLPEQIKKRGQEIASARAALQELEAQGMQPLRAGNITKSITAIASDKEYRASDVVQKTLGDLSEKIAALADKRGTIDAFDLYTVRKEAGNTIQKFADESKTFDKRLTSGLLSSVQKKIDDAIEAAGGKGWKEYLSKYQELSRPINRMETGQTLMNALQNPLETGERSQVFAKAVKDSDLSALSPKDFMDVRGIADDLSRTDAFQRLARGTKISGSEAIPGNVGVPLPNLLSRPAMIANFLMRHAGSSAEDKIAQVAARQYLNPNILAQGLNPPIPSRFQPLIDALVQQAVPSTTATTSRRF